MTGTPENSYVEDRNTIVKVYATGSNAWAHGLYFLKRWPQVMLRGMSLGDIEKMLCRQNKLPECLDIDDPKLFLLDEFHHMLARQHSLKARLFHKNGNAWRQKLPDVVCCGIIFPDELEKMFPTNSETFTYLPPAYECWYVFKYGV